MICLIHLCQVITDDMLEARVFDWFRVKGVWCGV